ncbi:hypothetical protein ACSNOK_20960 [Streptomyces sp. URMC 126]|uniref:hypothetical protein n=1 Tax=Streptomyces sp. URMC 126 TaxID=3423401 RepID=UPI003F1DF431
MPLGGEALIAPYPDRGRMPRAEEPRTWWRSSAHLAHPGPPGVDSTAYGTVITVWTCASDYPPEQHWVMRY